MKILSAMIASLALFAAWDPHCSAAEGDFPSKPMRFIVPYPAGGANDTVARVLAQKISESIGQPVIVDNRPGASGMLGADVLSKSPPDGYSIMIHTSSVVINPMISQGLRFDARQDLSPVTLMVNMKYALLVNPAFAARDLADLVSQAKASPGKLNYSSTGIGGPEQILMESFKRATGANIVHVPYKGGGPAMIAVFTNEVQMTFLSVSTSLPFVKSGKARVLAVVGSSRSKALPDVPTTAELGFVNFPTPWLGIFAPPKTLVPLIQRLNSEFVKALNAPDIRERLEGQGFEIVAGTPEMFGKFLEDETAFYGKLVREVGIKAE